MAGGCEADTEAGTEEAATGAAEGAWLTCGDGEGIECYRIDTADTLDKALTGTLDTEAEVELGTPGVWDNIARRAWTRDWLFENLYLLLDR